MTLREVADYVEDEGLGYAIEDGISPEDIEDVHLRIKWREADDAIKAIREMLPDTDGDDYDEDDYDDDDFDE